MPQVHNRDTGSLNTGIKLPLGARILISGESKARYVTYVMGSDKNGWHACFKGQGAVPVGDVEWQLIEGSSTADLPLHNEVAARTQSINVRLRNATSEFAVPFKPCSIDRMTASYAAFAGFDSAWTRGKRGAIATILLGEDGLAFRAPEPAAFSEALGILSDQKYAADLHVVAIDQPLIVQNERGSRPVEAAIRPTIGRFKGGMQPASRARAEMFGDAAPIWEFLREFQARSDPNASVNATSGRYVIEVYPALATLGLFEHFYARGWQPKYNPENRKVFDLSDWVALCAGVARAMKDLGIVGGAEWCNWAGSLDWPSKADQDAVDATISAICAYLWWRDGTQSSLLVGDAEHGYIVAPTHTRLSREIESSARHYHVPCTVPTQH